MASLQTAGASGQSSLIDCRRTSTKQLKRPFLSMWTRQVRSQQVKISKGLLFGVDGTYSRSPGVSLRLSLHPSFLGLQHRRKTPQIFHVHMGVLYASHDLIHAINRILWFSHRLHLGLCLARLEQPSLANYRQLLSVFRMTPTLTRLAVL